MDRSKRIYLVNLQDGRGEMEMQGDEAEQQLIDRGCRIPAYGGLEGEYMTRFGDYATVVFWDEV